MKAIETARPLKWTLYALAAVLPLAFIILVWQLIGMDSSRLCEIVKEAGLPPRNYCFELLKQALHIKGWVIWLLIGTIASFILIVLVAATKTLVGIVGPGGIALNINSNGGTQIKAGPAAVPDQGAMPNGPPSNPR